MPELTWCVIPPAIRFHEDNATAVYYTIAVRFSVFPPTVIKSAAIQPDKAVIGFCSTETNEDVLSFGHIVDEFVFLETCNGHQFSATLPTNEGGVGKWFKIFG